MSAEGVELSAITGDLSQKGVTAKKPAATVAVNEHDKEMKLQVHHIITLFVFGSAHEVCRCLAS